MTSNQLITLTLMQREHQRLEEQAERLNTRRLTLQDLNLLREHWSSYLGFQQYTPPLMVSLDQLIRQRGEGTASDRDYIAVVIQVGIYIQQSRYLVAFTYGNSGSYLLQEGRVHPVYEKAFEHQFEAKRPLSVVEQAIVLHRLFPHKRLYYDARHYDGCMS